MGNILLTGRPGIGKSTVIRRIIEMLGPDRVGGFWSSEIREDNRRVGFSLETVAGERGTLAHIDSERGPKVGKYVVNVSEIERVAIPAMVAARTSGKIIAIDEIAKMELYSSKFISEVNKCLDTNRVLATIQQRSNPSLNEIRKRSDITLHTVSIENRELLPEQLYSELIY
ncbi:MAG: NTPase [Candidatus Thorarchaeota archaeon]|jgi:nucleoside-triphosphatase